MSSSEITFNVENGNVFFEKFDNEEKSSLNWVKLLEYSNLSRFDFINSNFKVDFEKNIPELIRKNPKLNEMTFFFDEEIIDFNHKNLNGALQEIKLEKLTILNRGNVEITNQGLNLKSFLISLENCHISKLDLIFLNLDLLLIEKIKNLTEIYLEDVSINDLPENFSSSASNLSISSPKFQKEDMFYNFIKCFPKLKRLELYYLALDCQKLKESLKRVQLIHLKFDHIQDFTNQEFLTDILTNLEHFYVTDSSEKLQDFPFFYHLKENQKLKSLVTINGIFNYQYADSFLKNNRFLKDLIIVSMHPLKGQMEILGKGLENNHSIETLSIDNNFEDEFELFVNGIMKNGTIKDIAIGFCEMKKKDCLILQEYLSSNNSLKSIYLTDSNFSNQYIYDFFKDLNVNKSLEMIYVNFIFEENACDYIKDFLSKNHTLKSLKIGILNHYKGLYLIADGLSVNKSLKTFECETNFALKHKIEIGKKLFYNESLIELKLNKDVDGYLSSILKRNMSLIKTMKIDLKYFKDIKFNFQ